MIADVLHRAQSFDDARKREFERETGRALSGPDKGLAQLIATTVLRTKPILSDIINAQLNRPLPARHTLIGDILLCATAQLLILKTPPHAAINIAVEQARRAGGKSPHLAGLVNAVLRKIAKLGPQAMQSADVTSRAIPKWLYDRWLKTYGEETTRKITSACLSEAPLDMSIKGNPESWAQKLDATVLETGTLRRMTGGRVEDLAGYNEGEWWIQDAAAALPARMLGDVKNKTVVDLCAAPGGKTAQLVMAGASVIALDHDKARVERLEGNLDRLNLNAQCVTADVLSWNPDRKFDRILLDAPCTATGTIRRHPDILYLKREGDVATMAKRQRAILDAACALLEIGGTAVYCTCSLEPEEGELQIQQFLRETPAATIVPLEPGECGINSNWITKDGFLRTLPFHSPARDKSGTASVAPVSDGTIGGMDGFFAARLSRAG